MKTDATAATDGIDGGDTRVVAPDTMAGRAKTNNPQMQDSAAEDARRLKSRLLQGASSTVGAIYGDFATKDLFSIAAASGPVRDPATTVDEIFGLALPGGGELGSPKEIEPGPLGGHAKCADARASGEAWAICAWADSGSIGVLTFFAKQVNQVKDDFVAIRGEIEKRG